MGLQVIVNWRYLRKKLGSLYRYCLFITQTSFHSLSVESISTYQRRLHDHHSPHTGSVWYYHAAQATSHHTQDQIDSITWSKPVSNYHYLQYHMDFSLDCWVQQIPALVLDLFDYFIFTKMNLFICISFSYESVFMYKSNMSMHKLIVSLSYSLGQSSNNWFSVGT